MEHIKEDNRYYIDFSGNNKTIMDNEELYPVYEQGIDPIEDLCTEFNKLDARNKELEQENKYLQAIYISSMLGLNTAKHYKGKPKERYEYWKEPDWIIDKANKGQGDYYKIIDKQEAVLLLNGYNDLLSQQEQDNFHFSYTENREEFWKDKLDLRDKNVSIELKNRDLVIKVGVPGQMQYVFHYVVTGKVWHRELD